MQTYTSFKDQVALVCGGTGRVGSTICTRLAAQGTRAVIQYRTSSDVARALVQQIEEAGGEAVAVQADITDEESVRRLVSDSEQRFGALHILVNTVHGHVDPKNIAEMNWSDWAVHLDALKAHFQICRAVLPIMRRQHYGRIVFISAGLSRRLLAGCSTYSTIKAGLNAFSKTLALEEGRYGITVNIVAPGKVVPANGRESTEDPELWEERNQELLRRAPLGRHATAGDVAQAVLYFSSPEASNITGQTLFVAGGEIMP